MSRGRDCKVALGTLDIFRPTVGAAALGFARRALDEAVACVRARAACSASASADQQLTQARLAEMALDVDASALLVYRAAWVRDTGAPRVTREAAMAKLYATEAASARRGRRGPALRRTRRDGGRDGRAPLSRGAGAADLRGHERDPEAGDRRTTAAGRGARSGVSAHRDTFARTISPRAPSGRQWITAHDLNWRIRPRSIAPREFLDRHVTAGRGGRVALVSPQEKWTYAQLLDRVNRIANVLVDDLGLIPGNRVLLRGPNNPMMAAAWFAVLKAGGICVTTMPLLRPRELAAIIEKAQVALALCDARFIDDLAQAAAAAPVLKRIVPFDGADGELDLLMRRASPSSPPCRRPPRRPRSSPSPPGRRGRRRAQCTSHRDILAICDLFPRSCLKASESDSSAVRRRWPSPSDWAGSCSSRCGSVPRRCCWNRPRHRISSRASRTTASRCASPPPRRTARCSACSRSTTCLP